VAPTIFMLEKNVNWLTPKKVCHAHSYAHNALICLWLLCGYNHILGSRVGGAFQSRFTACKSPLQALFVTKVDIRTYVCWWCVIVTTTLKGVFVWYQKFLLHPCWRYNILRQKFARQWGRRFRPHKVHIFLILTSRSIHVRLSVSTQTSLSVFKLLG